jgi:hypothetical protein
MFCVLIAQETIASTGMIRVFVKSLRADGSAAKVFSLSIKIVAP